MDYLPVDKVKRRKNSDYEGIFKSRFPSKRRSFLSVSRLSVGSFGTPKSPSPMHKNYKFSTFVGKINKFNTKDLI